MYKSLHARGFTDNFTGFASYESFISLFHSPTLNTCFNFFKPYLSIISKPYNYLIKNKTSNQANKGTVEWNQSPDLLVHEAHIGPCALAVVKVAQRVPR